MKNKTFIIAVTIFCLGVVMLFGSSYSLIIGNLVTNESYAFEVANFNIQFSDNQKIYISGIPESDKDGIKNSKEFTFKVTNNSDYDVNYRIDILENNNTKMGDVIHYIYAINDDDYSEVLSLKDYYTIKQNKLLKVKKTDIYRVKMWLSLDADESYMNKSFSADIKLSATQNDYKYATTVIEKLANENKDNIVYETNNYRYSKNSSPNYLWFNCKEGFTKGDEYCEKWRIIGSFINKKEHARDEYYMLKIMNSKVVTDISFNNLEKNGDYDNSYVETFANGYYYDKLDDLSKKYIIKAKWNIGSTKSNNYLKSIYDENRKEYYSNVGLLNISDYLYMSKDFFIKNNIFFLNKNDSDVYILNDKLITGESNNSYNFLPCVYLRPDVSIVSGDGSINNPYEIAIKYPMNY